MGVIVLGVTDRERATAFWSAALGWDRYVGRLGAQVVMRTFGASAPFADLKKKFGFTADHVYDEAKKQLAHVKSSHKE